MSPPATAITTTTKTDQSCFVVFLPFSLYLFSLSFSMFLFAVSLACLYITICLSRLSCLLCVVFCLFVYFCLLSFVYFVIFCLFAKTPLLQYIIIPCVPLFFSFWCCWFGLNYFCFFGNFLFSVGEREKWHARNQAKASQPADRPTDRPVLVAGVGVFRVFRRRETLVIFGRRPHGPFLAVADRPELSQASGGPEEGNKAQQ